MTTRYYRCPKCTREFDYEHHVYCGDLTMQIIHRCDDCGGEVPDADVACFACLATDGQRDLVEMENAENTL